MFKVAFRANVVYKIVVELNKLTRKRLTFTTFIWSQLYGIIWFADRRPKYDISKMSGAEKRLFEVFAAAMKDE